MVKNGLLFWMADPHLGGRAVQHAVLAASFHEDWGAAGPNVELTVCTFLDKNLFKFALG